MSEEIFFLNLASARFVGQIKRRYSIKQNNEIKQSDVVQSYQPYHVFRTKQQVFVIHFQPRFVDDMITYFIFTSEFRVYALAHAKKENFSIAQQTFKQYQHEFDAGQLTEEILAVNVGVVYADRSNRNYFKGAQYPRHMIYKSGWKGEHGIDECYVQRVFHWAELRKNGRVST